MSSLKHSPWSPADAGHPAADAACRVAATALRHASAALARWARHVERQRPRPPGTEHHLEFHADAGAPEGALYLDGKLVGWLAGVRRL